MHDTINQHQRGVLASLRASSPPRALTFAEALRVAELQANQLLALFSVFQAPTPTELLSELPRITVRLDRHLPVSGSTFWDGSCWIITLNASEPWTRRRHTLCHEFKHIIDHGAPSTAPEGRSEQLADFFAGCLLVPKRLLKTSFFGGMQRQADLARAFDVSIPAIRVRLAQVGLGGTDRHSRANFAQRSQRRLPAPRQPDGHAWHREIAA